MRKSTTEKRSPGRWHVEIDAPACLCCAGCVAVCPAGALEMNGLVLQCADPSCTGCELCVRFCPVAALVLGRVLESGPRDPLPEIRHPHAGLASE